MASKDDVKSIGGILQEPAEGDRDTIDRELARKDGGNSENDADGAETSEHDRDGLHDTVRKAMDEAAPQTGVRPGP